MGAGERCSMNTARHVRDTAGSFGPEVHDCERCEGTGEISGSYGGDGYGDRCCGWVDYEAPCPDCKGTGKTAAK